ncbi:hypothetical protein CHE218_17810 [Microbacterium sp. che218]
MRVIAEVRTVPDATTPVRSLIDSGRSVRASTVRKRSRGEADRGVMAMTRVCAGRGSARAAPSGRCEARERAATIERPRRRGATWATAGAAASATSSTTSRVVLADALARICVNMPDHANIAAHEIVSKSARLIVADTNSVIEAMSHTSAMPVPIAMRLPRRLSISGALSSSTRNPSTMEPATLSCRSLSVLRGMQPTRARFTPTQLRQRKATVAAPRRTGPRPRRAMSRRTQKAKTTTIIPLTLSVVLKNALERSPKMPSWLKCRCHHSGSLVVAIASSRPPTSVVRAAAPTWSEDNVPSRRVRPVRRGTETETGTAERSAVLMMGDLSFRRNGDPPSSRDPRPPSARSGRRQGETLVLCLPRP